MGRYIQTPENKNKAQQIVNLYGGKIVDFMGATAAMKDPSKGVICVVDNGPFEAAAYAYDEREFRDFSDDNDTREKDWVVMDRDRCEAIAK